MGSWPNEPAWLAGVTVAMMKVGKVRVIVTHRRVPMPMGVGLARGLTRLVDVLMMLVVDVTMFMIHRFVGMLMHVTLR